MDTIHEVNGKKIKVITTKTMGQFMAISFTDVSKDDCVTQWAVVNKKDPEPVCYCPNELKANAVAAAMDVADKMCSIFSATKDEIAKKVDADVNKFYYGDKMVAKMKELTEAGKTQKEIMEYMLEHRNEFLRDPNKNPIPTLDKSEAKKDW